MPEAKAVLSNSPDDAERVPVPPATPIERERQKTIRLLPESGERALIVGQTGSGKTAFACWLLKRMPDSPIIILDTKDEPKFLNLKPCVVVENADALVDAFEKGEADYIILRPPVEIMHDPEALDEILFFIFKYLRGITLYVDEAYTFHNNGRAGRGLIALMTRGRSKGITTVLSTQRPVLLSRFCITESQIVYAFRLIDKSDRKRLSDVIPDFADMPQPVEHGFWFFRSGEDAPEQFSPIKLDNGMDTGYTEKSVESVPEVAAEPKGPKHVWV